MRPAALPDQTPVSFIDFAADARASSRSFFRLVLAEVALARATALAVERSARLCAIDVP